MADFSAEKPCRILSLDGGGAKGFYTLGVLREIEGMVQCPLHEKFDLIFGTSTGAEKYVGAVVKSEANVGSC
jgi:patatin-like phospholipase/acyl hydrolase